MTRMRRIGTSLLLAMLVASCASVPERVLKLDEYQEPERVKTMSVPYPILLLHGLGQKADVWDGAATRYFTEDLDLTYGGTLRVKDSLIIRDESGGGEADYYVVAFSDPWDSVGAWGLELEKCVDYVIDQTKADRVIIIGYSMGGLAARSFMVKRFTDHHVKRLITVGTPHLGSAYARVYDWKKGLLDCVAHPTDPLSEATCKGALGALKGVEGTSKYDSYAVRDLRRPQDGGWYLQRLGKMGHPLDVEYVSVIGTIDMFDEAKKLSEPWIQELLRKTMSFFSPDGVKGLFEPGDGVVSKESQDIQNIEWFTVKEERRRAARTVTVPTVHVEHLKRSNEIQRVSLEDKPELVAERFYREGSRAIFAVDVRDHIPELCTVDITAAFADRSDLVMVSRQHAGELVRTQNGIVSRTTVYLDDPRFFSQAHATLIVTVTNSFGYKTQRKVTWTSK